MIYYGGKILVRDEVLEAERTERSHSRALYCM